MPSAARFVWSRRLSGWGRPRPSTDGYDLVLAVPGDLPVFLRMALAVCGLQDSAHRNQTFIVPDVMTETMREIHAQAAPGWDGALRLLELPQPERMILPLLGDPGRNHAYQILTAVRASTSTHVMLHDADLFLPEPGVHRQQYERAERRQLDVLGVEPAWDTWFADRGRTLAATWEMLARTEWMRSFPPHRLMGHDAVVEGEEHTFDTTFWGQWNSSPASVGVDLPDGGVVHFNYVISAYRKFRRAPAPWHDHEFRLLLIRAFIDLFDADDAATAVPSLDELVQGLEGPACDGPVFYLQSDRLAYEGFRDKFRAILSGPWAPGGRGDAARYVEPFDRFFQSVR